MTWDDEGFLISKNKYSENSLIVEIFTKNYGKVSGIIFGGTSRKIKNYLQLGNQLHVNYSSKTENKIGNFKIELIKAYAPIFFDNYRKLLCIFSAFQLIKILTAESQKNIKIYDLIENFYILLKKESWIKNYIFWELELFKIIGYDLELKNLVKKELINNEVKYLVKSTKENKIVPNFLIDDNQDFLNEEILIDGLRLVGDYLEKSILRPNNINYPLSRLRFLNTFK
jgi:DNA repair protein RecO (recombination protein O)